MKVAVVTGGHAFDVIGFHQLFRNLEGLDCYIQSLEDWAADVHRYGSRYDVVVFYTMHTAMPDDCPGGKRTRQAIDGLGDGTGILVLHHGILAFKGDDVWDHIVGITDRTIDGCSHDERLEVNVADRDHPITQGIDDWALIDETYDFRNAEGEDSHVLLTVDHENSMDTMAWIRTHGESRVLNLVLGHDAQTWENATFQEVLGRGIRWCGRAL